MGGAAFWASAPTCGPRGLRAATTAQPWDKAEGQACREWAQGTSALAGPHIPRLSLPPRGARGSRAAK